MNNCQSCRFFESRAKECRAEPPRVFIQQNDRRVSYFPETSRDHWCGKHEREEQAHRFELGSPLIIEKDYSHG